MAEEKIMEQKIENIKEHIYNFPIELEANNSIKIYSKFDITKIFINIKNIYTQFPESFKKYRSISGYLIIDKLDKPYKDIIDDPSFNVAIQQIIDNKIFTIKLIGVDIFDISYEFNQAKLKFHASYLIPSY